MSRGRDLSPPSPSRGAAYRHESEHEVGTREHAARATRPGNPREVLREHLDLPRSNAREPVALDSRRVNLRASEVEILAAAGTFRVIDARDLNDGSDRADRWHGDLRHLQQQGLVNAVPHVLDGERTTLITLTKDGRTVLEQHRAGAAGEAPQQYYTGSVKARETTHDAQLFRVYQAAAAGLHGRGASIKRVVLDVELKREYQRFLQDRNRGNSQSDGRPKRSPEEIAEWAHNHDLSVVDGHVQFPDVRIEYEHPDGVPGREDLELATEHYSTRAIGAKQSAGFTVSRGTAGRLRGGSSRRGKAPFEPTNPRRRTT
jgi:DNA-binding MarR family transcriptional regulator